MNELTLNEICHEQAYYYRKLVVSGELLQLYEFDRPIRYGHQAKRPVISRPETPDPTLSKNVAQLLLRDKPTEKRADNKLRAQRDAKRLVHANMTIGSRPDHRCDLWITLTVANADDGRPHERDRFIKNVSIFLDRFKRKYGHDGAIYALELQDGKRWRMQGINKPPRNVLHAHVLIFGAPKVVNTHVAKCWGLGYTITKWLTGSKEEVYTYANYISKYIQKDPIATTYEKLFIATHDLKRPLVYRNVLRVARVLRDNQNKVRHVGQWHPINDRKGTTINYWRYAEYRLPCLPTPKWAVADMANGGTVPAEPIPLHYAPVDT